MRSLKLNKMNQIQVLSHLTLCLSLRPLSVKHSDGFTHLNSSLISGSAEWFLLPKDDYGGQPFIVTLKNLCLRVLSVPKIRDYTNLPPDFFNHSLFQDVHGFTSLWTLLLAYHPLRVTLLSWPLSAISPKLKILEADQGGTRKNKGTKQEVSWSSTKSYSC